MSFWKFIGEFALFNMICDLFTSKPQLPTNTTPHSYNDTICNDYFDDDSAYMHDDLPDYLNDLDDDW